MLLKNKAQIARESIKTISEIPGPLSVTSFRFVNGHQT